MDNIKRVEKAIEKADNIISFIEKEESIINKKLLDIYYMLLAGRDENNKYEDEIKQIEEYFKIKNIDY